MNTNRGFSLLEAIVAITIATVIILLAASAVRTATQSLRLIESTAQENALLARGWLEAMHDVDYWNSHANPDYPYLAGPMSEEVDISGSIDHPYDKRPFRPVTFTSDLNPGSLMPHDPRTWYRGGMSINTESMTRAASSFKLVLGWATTPDAITGMPPFDPDFAKARVKDLNKTAGPQFLSNDSQFPIYPAGWQPWHQFGDYSSMSRALYWDTGANTEEFAIEVAKDNTRATTDYLPTVQWKLFSDLGHLGAVSYMPPGTLSLYVRPNTNRKVENIGKVDKLVDWGEVPWTFARGTATDPVDGFSPESFAFPNASAFSGGGLSNIRRRNTMLGFPGSGNELTVMRAENVEWIQRIDRGKGWPSGMSSWVTTSPHRNGRSGYNTIFAACLETAVVRGFGRPTNWSKDDPAKWNAPFAYFYPGRAFLIGNEWDTETLIDRTILEPVRQLYDDRYISLNNSKDLAATQKRMWNRFSMRTRHQPSASTNDDRTQIGDEDMLQMDHRIVRYRSDYAERARVWVTVTNPESGKSYTVGASAIGTTFRGARQHWGWKSQQAGWAHHDMGDRYVAP